MWLVYIEFNIKKVSCHLILLYWIKSKNGFVTFDVFYTAVNIQKRFRDILVLYIELNIKKGFVTFDLLFCIQSKLIINNVSWQLIFWNCIQYKKRFRDSWFVYIEFNIKKGFVTFDVFMFNSILKTYFVTSDSFYIEFN